MPRFSQENLVSDMCKFANQMLNDLNKMYPPFKQRFRAYKFIKPRESTEVASSTEEAAKS